jgi:hypothetical protein
MDIDERIAVAVAAYLPPRRAAHDARHGGDGLLVAMIYRHASPSEARTT